MGTIRKALRHIPPPPRPIRRLCTRWTGGMRPESQATRKDRSALVRAHVSRRDWGRLSERKRSATPNYNTHPCVSERRDLPPPLPYTKRVQKSGYVRIYGRPGARTTASGVIECEARVLSFLVALRTFPCGFDSIGSAPEDDEMVRENTECERRLAQLDGEDRRRRGHRWKRRASPGACVCVALRELKKIRRNTTTAALCDR